MLSPLTGGEITFGPRFRLQPAGLGWAPGKATPRKRSPGRSARPRPGKLYPHFRSPSHPGEMQATRGNAVHRRQAVSARALMHVKQCTQVENHGPGCLQLKICSGLRFTAGRMQRAACSRWCALISSTCPTSQPQTGPQCTQNYGEGDDPLVSKR